MVKSFTSTTFHANIKDATFVIKITEGIKYENTGFTIEVEYTGVIGWDIIGGGIEAAKIESETDESGVDEYHEYLILYFENGDRATFRNSHVDMFIR